MYQSAIFLEPLEQRTLLSGNLPAAQFSASATTLSQPRGQITAIGLGNYALLVGGAYGLGQTTNAFDLYDTNGNTWVNAEPPIGDPLSGVNSRGTAMIFENAAGPDGTAAQAFDLQTRTWTIQKLPQPMVGTVAAAVGSKILVVGNYNSRLGNVYDSASKTWSTLRLPFDLAPSASVTAGDRAFFVGGQGTNPYVADAVYDGPTGQWSRLALPDANGASAAIAVGDEAFFANVDGQTVSVFNTVSNRWTGLTLPDARFGPAVTAIGDKVIFAGGNISGLGTSMVVNSDAVDVYDTATGQWSTTTLSVARNSLSATSAGDEVLIAGGDTALASASNAVDILTDQDPTPSLSGSVEGRSSGRGTVILQNSGDADLAGPYTVQIYAIPPRQYHNAVLVGSQAVNSTLAAGASLRFSIPINLASAPAGTYHLVAMVKAANGTLTPFAGATQNFIIAPSPSATPAVKSPAEIRPAPTAATAARSDAPNTWLTDSASLLT